MSEWERRNGVLSCCLSDRGHVRRRNEDAVLALPDAGLWAVADGMGGHADGDVASREVVETLAVCAGRHRGRVLVERVPEALQAANRELIRYGAGRVVGSTVAVLVLEDENYHCFWAGDSRIYLWRDRGLRQLTEDHVAGPGTAWPDALTRAVGVEPDLEPAYRTGYLYERDVLLLCTDGLTKVVDDVTIAGLLDSTAPQHACRRLVDAALVRGGPDNVSCVTVAVGW